MSDDGDPVARVKHLMSCCGKLLNGQPMEIVGTVLVGMLATYLQEVPVAKRERLMSNTFTRAFAMAELLDRIEADEDGDEQQG